MGKFWHHDFDGNAAIGDDSVRRLSELSENYLDKGSHEHLMNHDGLALNDTKVVEALEAATNKLQRFVPEAADFKEQAAEALRGRRLQFWKPKTPKPTPAPTPGTLFKVVTAKRLRQAEE